MPATFIVTTSFAPSASTSSTPASRMPSRMPRLPRNPRLQKLEADRVTRAKKFARELGDVLRRTDVLARELLAEELQDLRDLVRESREKNPTNDNDSASDVARPEEAA